MLLNNTFTEWFYRAFNLELPELDTLDDYIDFILPKIVGYSEDLYEEEVYTEKPWREVRDEDNFLDVILHIFKQTEKDVEIKVKGEDEGKDYLISIDGNVEKGKWDRLKQGGSNLLLLKTSLHYEMFERVFVNGDFFILKKHGDRHLSGKRKYLVLGKEGVVKRLEWREVVELLYNLYRFRMFFLSFLVGLILFVGIIVYFSFF